MADISSQVVVNQAFLKQLANADKTVKQAVRNTMQSVVLELEKITKEKLSGPVLKVQTGRLRSSVGSSVQGIGSDTVGRFGVVKAPGGKPIVYAAIHEFGGTIRPKIKKWLRFKTADKRWHTVKEVKMPMRSYIRSTAKEKKGWIRGRFDQMMKAIFIQIGQGK